MIHDAVLIRTAGKVTSYVEKYIRLVGIEKREEVLILFDNMQQFFPQWAIGTCPVMHPEIQYMSDTSVHMFGYSKKYLLENSSPEKYFRHVHESDQKDLYDCFGFSNEHFLTVPSEEHHLYRCVMHYRFRKADGQYIYLHDEKASLHLPGSGNLYYTIFRDVTAEKAFTGVKAELYKRDETLIKLKEFKPVLEQNPLSKREQELVSLIRQGLSTKEIAWYLKISHNTVRNIKSKLFEKFNVNNSIELLNMAG